MTENTNGFLYLNSKRLRKLVIEEPKFNAVLPEAANLIYESAEATGVDVKRIVVRFFPGEPEEDEMEPSVILDVITFLTEEELFPMKVSLANKMVLFEDNFLKRKFDFW